MRNTTISSSFASAVVSLVAHRVVLAGMAVRTFLQLTSSRQPMGYWLERYQSDIAGGRDHHGHHPIGNLKAGFKPGLLPHFGNSALAFCPAPAAIAAVRANRQG